MNINQIRQSFKMLNILVHLLHGHCQCNLYGIFYFHYMPINGEMMMVSYGSHSLLCTAHTTHSKGLTNGVHNSQCGMFYI